MSCLSFSAMEKRLSKLAESRETVHLRRIIGPAALHRLSGPHFTLWSLSRAKYSGPNVTGRPRAAAAGWRRASPRGGRSVLPGRARGLPPTRDGLRSAPPRVAPGRGGESVD